MNFTERIKNLNQSYSFNLFSLLGVVIFIFRAFCLLKNNYTYGSAIIDYLLFPALFLLIFIISVFELVFKFKIKNTKILNNKVLNIIKVIGTLTSLTYVILIILFILNFFILSFLH